MFTWLGGVLIEYLVYFQDAYSRQGEYVDRGSMFCNKSEEECFFFDIDVKGGEKSLGEEIRMQCMGACVAINAKGGDCWKIFNRQRMKIFNRQRMLVIDGKYNSEDGKY
jgi:hypothetical protein